MKITILLLTLIISGCSLHSNIGENDRFSVDSIVEIGAPSVTIISDKLSSSTYIVGGQSLLSQVSGPASAALLSGGFNRKNSMNVNNTNTFSSSSKNNLNNVNSLDNSLSNSLNQEQSQSSANLNVNE